MTRLYARHSATGLVQQGWKDSHDSVFHADGRLAEGPIALCEVQGYAYAARIAAAQLADALGHHKHADLLREQAKSLRERFQERFWCAEIGLYALALDGEKRPCRVRSSNAGHCVYTGIAASDHASAIVAALEGDTFFSGWGVRTIADSETRYNPMAYHNGSVWPHDNAIIAAAVTNFTSKNLAQRILAAQLDASTFFDSARLPELFCGFRLTWISTCSVHRPRAPQLSGAVPGPSTSSFSPELPTTGPSGSGARPRRERLRVGRGWHGLTTVENCARQIRE